jgi:hypothetical protein
VQIKVYRAMAAYRSLLGNIYSYSGTNNQYFGYAQYE